MNKYIDYYTESEFDVLFNEIYEIKGISKIKELSRQLRTFFNYKAEMIRYRFRANVPSDHFSNKISTNNKLYTQKREIESLSQDFITLLTNIKRNDTTLEQEIYYLHFNKNPKKINKLSRLTEKISTLIHFFSEEGIYDRPKVLKFIVVLAQHACFVNMYLKAEFSAFYEELKMNYQNLEKELNDLLGEVSSVKNRITMKRREEGLLL